MLDNIGKPSSEANPATIAGLSAPCSRLTVLAFVSPCGNWRRVDDRHQYGMSPLWGVINSKSERCA